MIRRITLSFDDFGDKADALKQAFAQTGGLEGLAGVRQEAGVYQGRGRQSGDPVNVAEIAIVNEFGSQDGRIPSRPAFRQAFDSNVDRYERVLRDELGKVADGTLAPEDAIDRVVLMMEGDIAQSIVDLSDPPNAPVTIARKRSSNPLVDTGQLHQSVDSAVVRADGSIARPWKVTG